MKKLEEFLDKVTDLAEKESCRGKIKNEPKLRKAQDILDMESLMRLHDAISSLLDKQEEKPKKRPSSKK